MIELRRKGSALLPYGDLIMKILIHVGFKYDNEVLVHIGSKETIKVSQHHQASTHKQAYQ